MSYEKVTSEADLEALYDAAKPKSLTKVAKRLTPLYREWIGAARFVILSTVGPEGTDASPRGDDGPVVRMADDTTLLMPDWRGNNRLDCLRNIVRDARVSLMFMVPGESNVVRVNGSAIVSADPALTTSFEQRGNHPRSVIVVTIDELYFQCAKAIMRSGLWNGAPTEKLPTAGQFLREVEADFDADAYDSGYVENSKPRMW